MIQHDFMQSLADTLEYVLLEKLDMDGEGAASRFEAWLAEDPNIERKRERLQKQLQTLKDVKTRLESY